MILFCLIAAYFIVFKGPLEDMAYWIKREESPRAKARREYQQAHGGSVGQKLAHAVADRAAARIANPRGPGRIRQYLSGLVDDGLYAAEETRRRRRAEREARRNGAPVGEAIPTTPDGVPTLDENLNGEPRRWWQWRRRPAPTPAANQAGTDPSAPSEPDPPETPAQPEAQPGPTPGPGAVPPPPPGGIPPSTNGNSDSAPRSGRNNGRPTRPSANEVTECQWLMFDADMNSDICGDSVEPGHQYCEHHEGMGGAGYSTNCDFGSDRAGTGQDSSTSWSQPETAPPGTVYATATRMDQTPPLAITAGPLALTAAPSTPPQQFGGFTMSDTSTPVAGEGGLAAFKNYVEGMKAQAEAAGPSLDTTIGSMNATQWGSAVTDPLHQAGDLFTQIANLMSQCKAALDQSEQVKDSYQSADHTGSKESVLAE
jgi:hypothetical protein